MCRVPCAVCCAVGVGVGVGVGIGAVAVAVAVAVVVAVAAALMIMLFCPRLENATNYFAVFVLGSKMLQIIVLFLS